MAHTLQYKLYKAHFVTHCENFPNTVLFDFCVLSSDMTSGAYEDNFQLCFVSELKKFRAENNARKFGVFWKIDFLA